MLTYQAPTSNFWSSSLNGTVNDTVDTITLNSTTGLQYPGVVVIDREDGNGTATPNAREVIAYTGISGTDLTGCTRGAENSTARSHSSGALVEAVFSVGQWNDLIDSYQVQHNDAGTHKMGTTKCRAYLSGNQTINDTTWTKIAFDTETYDIGSNFDSTTNYRFTAPVTGYYLIRASVLWGSMGSNDFYLDIYVNNSAVAQDGLKPAAGASFSQKISDIIYLTSSQYVEIFVYQNSGGGVTIGGGGNVNNLSIHLLSV